MAKPWGGAGAWAAEAEQAEAEAKAANRNLPADAFPSLGETMTSGAGKGAKKKKPQTFSISEFTVGKYVGPGGKSREMSNGRGLSAEEMMMLPTGPRDRSNEEPESQGGLGGGFSNYGGFRGAGDRDARDRGYGGGFDRDRDRESGRGDRFGRDRDGDMREDGPYRADDSADWGANKKAPPSFGLSYQASGGGSDRGGREGYAEDRGRLSDRDLPSRADEVENWGSSKKFVPSAPAGGGDGFDRRAPRVGVGFEDAFGRRAYDDTSGGISRADEVDDWGAAKKFVPRPTASERHLGGGGGGFVSTYRDSGSDVDRWTRREVPSRDEVSRPSERPRLVLQPRTLPVQSMLPTPQPIDEKLPPHAADSRPEASVEQDGGVLPDQPSVVHDAGALPDQLIPEVKPKPRPNPFGSARPREEVLAEKGQDWRKLDADLDMKRPQSRPQSSHSNRSSRPQTPEIASEQGPTASWAIAQPIGEETSLDSQIDDKGSEGWRKPGEQDEN